MKFDNGIVMRGLRYVYSEIFVFAGDPVLVNQQIRVTDRADAKPAKEVSALNSSNL